jgi:hypothetical protein
MGTNRARDRKRGGAIRKAILESGYALPSYDLIGGAPQLACALDALRADVYVTMQARPFYAPIVDVIASACREIASDRDDAQLFRWAWICMLDRTDEAPGLLLVTATQAIQNDMERVKLWDAPLRGHQIAVLRDTFALVRGSDPENWLVHDLKIGRRSQFLQPVAVPGTEFATGRWRNDIIYETAQIGMDVAISVEYVGPRKTGAPFFATLIGLNPDAPDAPQAPRVHLPLSTGTPIRQGEEAELTTRSDVTFRPVRLVIPRTPSQADTKFSLHGKLEEALLAADEVLRGDLCSWLGGYLNSEGRFIDTRTRR